MINRFCVVALIVFSASAQATYCPDHSLIASHPNGDCSKPVPSTTPSQAPPTTSNSNASATQAQTATAKAAASSNSKSGASSDATGTGGNAVANGGVGTGGSATGGASSNSLGSVGNDSSQTSFRALALSLPSPVFTPPMPLASCPQANVEQEAHAVGWNFYSQAHGSVNTDNCTAIIVYNAMLAQCQFESAQNILDGLMAKVMPAYKARPMSGLNLSQKECHDLNTPPVAVAPVVSVSGPDYHIIDRGPSCAQPEPAPKKGKPQAKRVAKPTWKCKS